jgi:hypothetical protein
MQRQATAWRRQIDANSRRLACLHALLLGLQVRDTRPSNAPFQRALTAAGPQRVAL